MSEHLVRTIAMEMMVTPKGANFESLAIFADSLYRDMEREAAKNGMVITKSEVTKSEEIYYGEDGIYPVVMLRGLAYAYKTDESAEQTIVKLGIDEALGHWVPSDGIDD